MINIYGIYKTFQGAWVITGIVGMRQYMGYTKAEAIKKYNDLAKKVRR